MATELGALPPWPATLAEAQALQMVLRERVRLDGEVPPLTRIGGVDVSNTPGTDRFHAAAVSLSWPDLALAEESGASGTPTFPYVPGFLSFREVPVVWAALAGLARLPGVIVVDGHGYAHPRRIGIACHLGVLLDRPTIGCAKRILVGRHEPLANEAGSRQPLVHRGEVVGMALRTRTGVQPVYVSVGHRLTLEAAVDMVWQSVRRYRLPEPTRQAHLAANRFRRLAEAG
jgi:deoxyribonuclease V